MTARVSDTELAAAFFSTESIRELERRLGITDKTIYRHWADLHQRGIIPDCRRTFFQRTGQAVDPAYRAEERSEDLRYHKITCLKQGRDQYLERLWEYPERYGFLSSASSAVPLTSA